MHRSTGSRTDLAEIRARDDDVHRATGSIPLVVVDYLQKVLVPGGPVDEADRSTAIVESLKDLAIDISAPVVAIATVARHHLTYDLGNAERFRRWAVLSIEKNRFGRDGVDLEYRKRFEQGRFEPDGRLVEEQLIDDRVFTE